MPKKLQKLDDLLRDYYANPNLGVEGEKQEAILNALQSIYGEEQGTLDYVGYSISGNYKMSVDQAIEFINLELGDFLEKDIEDQDINESKKSSNSL